MGGDPVTSLDNNANLLLSLSYFLPFLCSLCTLSSLRWAQYSSRSRALSATYFASCARSLAYFSLSCCCHTLSAAVFFKIC